MPKISPANITPAQPQDKETPSHLNWQSGHYPDTYFSQGNPLEEKDYVFLQKNDLQNRFQKLETSQFTITETGFGTGLNFLLTAAQWEKNTQNRPQQPHLNYISIEKHPLNLKDLQNVHQQWPSLSNWSKRLQSQYPPLLPATHRLNFTKSRITLTLIFADIQDALNQLQSDPNLKTNAWYLDGFSPSSNPDMWQDNLYKTMAQTSAPNATLATYTCAGFIRRGLKAAGFIVSKTKGHGKKRDMTIGHLSTQPTKKKSKTPYFQTQTTTTIPKTAVVIGAGLAGSAIAHTLANQNIHVTVIERNQPAQGGSGNHMGIFEPLLSKDHNIPSQFQLDAFLTAKKHLQNLASQNICSYIDTGVTQIHINNKEYLQQQKIQKNLNWPQSFFTVLNSEKTQKQLKLQTLQGTTHFHQAGCINPPSLVNAHLHHPNITLLTQQKVIQIKHKNNQWLAIDQHAKTIATADTLIIASANDALAFKQTSALNLHPIKGQTTLIKETTASKNLIRTALNFGQYITPAHQGYHTLGATFDPTKYPAPSNPQPTQKDHLSNIKKLKEKCPDIYNALNINPNDTHQGRASYRCATPDRMPLIGPMPNLTAYQNLYHDHYKGKHHALYPQPQYIPNLYLTLGHGSRGIVSTIFAAHYLTALITQKPFITSQQIKNAIHPARQLMKKLKQRP